MNHLDHLTVSTDASLFEALAVIDRGARGFVLVVDRRERIVGTLTDGDVRRAILDGRSLDEKGLYEVCRRDFVSVRRSASRAEVLDLMKARRIGHVPVVDARGRLTGLHLLREFVGGGERDNWAVILAGGRGERLGPLTLDVPKPMLHVAGRPILERLVLHIVGAGIRRIFISVNYLGHVIEQHFGDGSAFGCRIEYLREEEPLGTGGPLTLLPERPKLPILFMNGDLVTQVDIDAMLRTHAEEGDVITAAVHPYQVSIPFGVVDLDGRHVQHLREKPVEEYLVNAGIYVLSPQAIRLTGRRRAFPMTDLIRRCLDKALPVGTFNLDQGWQDIGRPEELRRARGQTILE